MEFSKMDYMQQFNKIHEKVVQKSVVYKMRSGLEVKKWLVSETLTIDYHPFYNDDKYGEWAPLLFHERESVSWSVYEETRKWLIYLNEINNPSLVIYGAFSIWTGKPIKAVIRLYCKSNFKIWLNGKLIFIAKADIKYLDEHIIVHLEEGHNFFVFEKTAQSIYITVN
jgi:hypothetical protein